MKNLTFAVVIATLAVTIVTLLANAVAKAECEARWKDSGLSPSYTLLSGCRIQLANGNWIPAANYREQ